MTKSAMDRRLVALYGLLLKLYPQEFRDRFEVEIRQTIEDSFHDVRYEKGAVGYLAMWPFVIKDLALTAAREHIALGKENMRKRQLIPLALGSVLLTYSALFAAINILKYELGFSTIWNPFQAIVESSQTTLVSTILNALIVVGPALAFGFYLLPLIRIRLDWYGEQMVVITIGRASRLTLILAGACLIVGAIFLGYVTFENLPCLLGQHTSC